MYNIISYYKFIESLKDLGNQYGMSWLMRCRESGGRCIRQKTWFARNKSNAVVLDVASQWRIYSG